MFAFCTRYWDAEGFIFCVHEGAVLPPEAVLPHVTLHVNEVAGPGNMALQIFVFISCIANVVISYTELIIL